MTNETAAPDVRYEVAGQAFDFETKGNLVNRVVRRTLLKNGQIMTKKFGHLVHPTTGERPTLVVSIPDPSKASIERRLDTDSETLRAWLVEKGFVKEQRTKGVVPSSDVAEQIEAEVGSASVEASSDTEEEAVS